MAARAKALLIRRVKSRSALPVWHPSLGSSFTPTFSADQHVGTALRETFQTFARSVTENLRPTGMSLHMWFVLRSLWETDGLRQVDLAARLEITPAAMVGLVNALEGAGLVARKRSESDGRAYRIFLTPDGCKVRTQATRQALQVDAKALGGFTVEEVETLLGWMQRMRSNLSK